MKLRNLTRQETMRKNIECFNDIYKENLDKIPLDDLGKMVYNKHYQVSGGFKY